MDEDQKLEEALKAIAEDSFLPEHKDEEKTNSHEKSERPLSQTAGLQFQDIMQRYPLDPVLSQLPGYEVDQINKDLLCRVCPNACWVKMRISQGAMRLMCICRSGGGMDKMVTFNSDAPDEEQIMPVVACGDCLRTIMALETNY